MSITMKQREAKPITLTITDSDGTGVDCSSTTCSFKLVQKHGGTVFMEKEDADFDKTDAATGILVFDISTTDSNIPAYVYTGEAKIIFTSTNIDKSQDIVFTIEKAA